MMTEKEGGRRERLSESRGLAGGSEGAGAGAEGEGREMLSVRVSDQTGEEEASASLIEASSAERVKEGRDLMSSARC